MSEASNPVTVPPRPGEPQPPPIIPCAEEDVPVEIPVDEQPEED